MPVVKRLSFDYLEGLNSIVSYNVAKKQEARYMENARSVQIGSVEKRKGMALTGNAVTTTANYGLFNFANISPTSTSLFRISMASGVVSVYYLLNAGTWTAMGSSSTNLCLLGESTTQFDITASGTTATYTYDGTGTDPYLESKLKIGDVLYVNAQNFAVANNGTFTLTDVGYRFFKVTNATAVVESNKTIGTGSIASMSAKYSAAQTDDRLFLVNGIDVNRYIEYTTTTGTFDTVRATDTAYTNHLYGAPIARKINLYKDRLYLADYISGGTRYKNTIFRSSYPLGLLALVSEDALAAATTIKISDTKYVRTTDVLDVYRGGTKIVSLTVSGKTETSITVTAPGVAILASDEVWVVNTYTGSRIFRWSTTIGSGTPVQQYDTFKMTGGDNDEVTMLTNINNIMMIASKSSIQAWNDSTLLNMDTGYGCVSHSGFAKSYGMLFFISYTGIYTTSGDMPRLISAKVNEYFTGATRSGLENAVLGKKEMSIYACIGDVTLYNPDGSVKKTLSDVCLEFDIKQENWYVHTGVPAAMMATYISSSDADKLVFAHDTNFNIYEFLSGTADISAEIPFSYSTNDTQLAGSFERICYPLHAIVEAEAGSNIAVFVSLDGGQEYELKTRAQKGCTLIRITPPSGDNDYPRCRKIRLILKEFSKDAVKITRLALVYKETEEEEIQRA